MKEDGRCSICLKLNQNVINVCENDVNNVQIIIKLQLCVPDIEWSSDYYICSSCLSQLDIVYSFRELCVHSQKVRQQLSVIPEETVATKSSHKSLEAFYPGLHIENFSISPCPGVSDNEDEALESKETFRCENCSIKFENKDKLLKHIKRNHDDNNSDRKEQNFICTGCGEKYLSSSEYEKHLISCEKVTASKYVTAVSDNKPPEETQIQTEESNLLQDFAQKDKSEEPSKEDLNPSNACNVCGNSFTNKYLLKRHLKNVHVTEKKYRCELCSSKFASIVYLNAHKRYHSRERTHICAFCGKGYITTSDLYHHEKIHANQRSYRCEKCSKAFNTSSDLHKHKICVHLDRSQWKYQCFYCQRRFPLKTNLDTHTKIHTGEKNFACHLCDHRCINKSVLMRHIETHSNVRAYKCNVCLQGYKYKKSLDFHMSKIHGVGEVPQPVKKFFCHICPKSYFVNNKLQKHIRAHTGEKPFKCLVCLKTFVDKSYVKQHMKMSHGQC